MRVLQALIVLCAINCGATNDKETQSATDGAYQLPHSRLMIHMPINVGLYLDRELREGKGLFPDLWLSAADAVNYAVAAVRGGTITTYQPLSPTALQQPFIAEDPWARVRQEEMVLGLVIGLITMASSVWAYFMRKKPLIVTLVGGFWIMIGSAWLLMGNSVGLGFLLVGAICLTWGGVNLWRSRRSSATKAA